MNKELMELKLRVDCFRCEFDKELVCFTQFFSMVEFFLARDIEDRVVEFWLEDYHSEIEVIKKHLESLENQK